MGYTQEETINWRFKKQMSNSGEHTKRYKKAWVDRQLFNYDLGLDINDWREIRSGDFWEIHDKIEDDLERNTFILKRVKQYVNG